ncbi:MAG: FGGY family carbohydrate kinase [Burkholderiales bacterium]|nr:FGGY family carbohydrate kinase [Burkholderiales bacterium]
MAEEHQRYVVGIDQGTTATKAFRLFNDGEFEPICAFEHQQFHPQPGWVEHDADELLANVHQCLDYAHRVEGLGLCNQGETVVAWNADTGEPVYRAIVWQDSRTQADVERLKADGAEALSLERAGLPLDPYFSASKLAWLLREVPQAKALAARGRLRLGTSDSFFIDRLTGTYATDITTASRTGLMNLATGQWDAELCRLFGVPIELLAPIVPNVHDFGVVERVHAPLGASAVDQQAALFGHGCHARGRLKITFGTGAFALAVSGDAPVRTTGGLLPTVAWRIGRDTTYAVDGGVYNAASALNWVKSLGLFRSTPELSRFDGPSALERGLVFVPALSGLACPYWDRSAAGAWIGIGLDTTREDLVRAALEGVALRSAQAVAALDAAVPVTGPVSVDGGLVLSRYFVDFLARALGREVIVPSSPDLTGLGICQLAFVGAGMGPVATLPDVAPPDRVVTPEAPLSAEQRARFADGVERVRGWRA